MLANFDHYDNTYNCKTSIWTSHPQSSWEFTYSPARYLPNIDSNFPNASLRGSYTNHGEVNFAVAPRPSHYATILDLVEKFSASRKVMPHLGGFTVPVINYDVDRLIDTRHNLQWRSIYPRYVEHSFCAPFQVDTIRFACTLVEQTEPAYRPPKYERVYLFNMHAIDTTRSGVYRTTTDTAVMHGAPSMLGLDHVFMDFAYKFAAAQTVRRASQTAQYTIDEMPFLDTVDVRALLNKYAVSWKMPITPRKES